MCLVSEVQILYIFQFLWFEVNIVVLYFQHVFCIPIFYIISPINALNDFNTIILLSGSASYPVPYIL